MGHLPGPAWAPVAAAAVFVLVAAYCALSLVVHGRPWDRASGAEANHVLMAVAMVAMVVPVAGTPAVAGLVLFAGVALGWLATLVVLRVRDRPLGSLVGGRRCCAHPAHLFLVNAAMTLMYVLMLPTAPPGPSAVVGTAGMEGMAGMHDAAGEHAAATPSPALTVLAVALGGYLVVHAVLSVLAPARVPRPATIAAPVVVVAPAVVVAPTGAVGGGTAGPGAVGAGPAGAGPAGVELSGPLLPRLISSAALQTGCQALMSAGMGVLLLAVLVPS